MHLHSEVRGSWLVCRRRPAPEQTPAVLPYLKSSQQRTLFDIHLEASVQPKGGNATTITKTNFQQL